MRARSTLLIAVALALLGAVPPAARAQDPTPTATATASPTATPSASSADAKTDWPKDVQRVYDDYRRDGVIDACAHSARDLRATLRSIDPQFEQDYPDFRPAVEAAIETHRRGGCKGRSGSSRSAGSGARASRGSRGSAGGPIASPTPAPGSGGSAGAQSGTIPGGAPTGSGGSAGAQPGAGASSGGGAIRGGGGNLSAAAAPAPTAPPAAVAPTAAPTPQLVVRRVHANRSLAVPGALLGVALLGLAALALTAAAARRSPRMAAYRHAFGEASYRARGTWADFSDWLRLGR
jgi:hypothetical protein